MPARNGNDIIAKVPTAIVGEYFPSGRFRVYSLGDVTLHHANQERGAGEVSNSGTERLVIGCG